MLSDTNEVLYSMTNLREHECSVRAHRDGSVRLCWTKLDRKSKKLTFNFQVGNMNSQDPANQDTLEVLNQELSQIQERLDQVSRNVYMQTEMDKQHFECKRHVLIMLSDCKLLIYPDMDVHPQDDPRARSMRWSSLLHHSLLHHKQGRQQKHA